MIFQCDQGSTALVKIEIIVESTSNQPSVTVLHPNGGESIPIGTEVQVSAHATDDTAVTSVTFSYSNNGGSTWNSIGAGTIVSGTDTDGIWNRTWNTNSLGAGSKYLIKAVASDGTSTQEDQSDSTFSLTYTPPPTPAPVPINCKVPAFTPSGMIVMIGLLAVAGFVMLRRRE